MRLFCWQAIRELVRNFELDRVTYIGSVHRVVSFFLFYLNKNSGYLSGKYC